MKDSDKNYCRILLDVLEAGGVKDVVASPGSRNAPLLISCSYRQNLSTRVITDERTAAFVALGMAMVSRKPVVLICTSGTALYNYAPAIAEAFYQKVPLILISADRPFHWIDQNDSQTLVQPGALEKIVRKSFDIPVESSDSEMDWYVARIANETLNICRDSHCAGPVHINIQFNAPLSNTNEDIRSTPTLVEIITPPSRFSPTQMSEITSRLLGKKILVVAGFMPPDDELNSWISLFSELPGVKLLCETISNLHINGNQYAIDTVLAGLTRDQKKELRPDIVISIGGALVSRMLKEFIREMKPEVWTLADTYHGIDCFKALSLHIDIRPAAFFKAVTLTLKKKYKKDPEATQLTQPYTSSWAKAEEAQLDIRNKFIDQSDWSELKAFKYILQDIPRNFNLFLSNGTCVRYAQLFTTHVPHASYSNRGVSGIEGTNATAAGCAISYNGPTLLITGDMSFAYAPGIMGIDNLPPDFKIIVINNRGGGIFRFISPTRYIEHRDRFFCANPHVPVRGLAECYGWKYFRVESEEAVIVTFKEFLEYSGNAVLEIFSDEEYSASLLRKYMRLNGLNDNKLNQIKCLTGNR